MAEVRRIFVANRGEIAVRIIRACHEVGVEAVLGVSSADVDSLGARMADRTVHIGPPPSAASYLNQSAIVHAALMTGCDALHPGYGFLSEKAAFASLCTENGIRFVGPSAESIDVMGDKINAIATAKRNGVPTVPGSDHVRDIAEAIRVGNEIGYPFLLKARAGGGGRGMRIVRNADELASVFPAAAAEAQIAFGNGELYIERYIERARHIEVQVLGDMLGNVIHLGERDCSVQRRHQKLIEESPSPFVTPAMREAMTSAAVRLAASQQYVGAGTVEFVVDSDTGEFFFLEMNTRIQVEHPVTEMVTGVDLVAEQIRVAGGLPLSSSPISFNGHSIECRINAEVAELGFRPSPGRIETWSPPEGDGIRVDTHCFEGYVVPPFYDSMIAKLIVHGTTREDALSKMDDALARFRAGGIGTTVDFQRSLINDPDFRNGSVTTTWLEKTFMPSFMARAEARQE